MIGPQNLQVSAVADGPALRAACRRIVLYTEVDAYTKFKPPARPDNVLNRRQLSVKCRSSQVWSTRVRPTIVTSLLH